MTPDNYRSLAFIASETGVGFFLLQEAMRTVEPSFRLNNVPYFGDDAARRLIETANAAAAASQSAERASAAG